MKHAKLILLVALCLFALTPVIALAADEGVIRGFVVNGTAGGGSVEGLEVTLRVFQGASEVEPLTALTDAQGQFQFEGLATGSDWGYLVRVDYQDVVYSRGVLSFEAGQSELAVEVEVYETTTDDSDIYIERAHLLVSVTDVGLEVTELYVFANPTDRTYVGMDDIGGRPWTSRFVLPLGSSGLALDDGTLGGRFLATEDGFVDTEPQWPGSTRVLFSYAMACPSGTCDLARELAHPISDLNMLIADAGATVDSGQLVFQGKRDAQGQPYLNYAASDLASGKVLDLRIRLPGVASSEMTSSRKGSQALPWIILGTVLTTLVLIYPFWRKRIEAAARKGE